MHALSIYSLLFLIQVVTGNKPPKTVPDFTLSYVSFQLLYKLIPLHPVDDGLRITTVAEKSLAVQDETHACQKKNNKLLIIFNNKTSHK